MQKFEPTNWRTDLIIFINDNSDFELQKSFLTDLNCRLTNRRTSNLDKPMCTLIKYVPLAKRKLPPLKRSLKTDYNHFLTNINIFSENHSDVEAFNSLCHEALKTYPYVDSISVAFDGYGYFKSAGFDFLLRSDMDVFLMPLFANWLPHNCNDFYVGQGGYSTEFNTKRLRRINKELNFEYANMTSLGNY